MCSIRSALFIAAATLPLAACQSMVMRPEVGIPEYAAYLTSRGYDCGLRVERGRLVALHRGQERTAYVSAGQRYSVQAYNRPQACGAHERAEVAAELRRLAQR